ncbi:hypothetical protein niasHT_024231 [Heterodera trifolii]|uniref:non-specific serine/threonine protein kinase n=1 Tax=Heterodera trifolii TaxID=157864 RepID=A0ABD2JLZ7_9BILA
MAGAEMDSRSLGGMVVHRHGKKPLSEVSGHGSSAIEDTPTEEQIVYVNRVAQVILRDEQRAEEEEEEEMVEDPVQTLKRPGQLNEAEGARKVIIGYFAGGGTALVRDSNEGPLAGAIHSDTVNRPGRMPNPNQVQVNVNPNSAASDGDAPEIRKYKKRFNLKSFPPKCTDTGLMLLDRSGQGKVYHLITRRRFDQMSVMEGQNILVTISGKKRRVRVYYLSWLKQKILRTEGVKAKRKSQAQKHGLCSVATDREKERMDKLRYERIKFLVIGIEDSISIYAWAPKPYNKFMAFKSFGQLSHAPVIVDLTIEENARLKVLYGSLAGFHAIDLDSASIYDIYSPQQVPIECNFGKQRNTTSFEEHNLPRDVPALHCGPSHFERRAKDGGGGNGLAIQTVSGIGKIVKIKIQAVRAHQNLRDLRIVGREMDDRLKDSLQRAFVFSKAACSRPNERRFFEEHKFTLTILPMVNRRAGGSFSAAASLGFLALAKRKRVDDSICVTGKVKKTPFASVRPFLCPFVRSAAVFFGTLRRFV